MVERTYWKELLPAKLVYVLFNVGASSVQNFLPVYYSTYFNKFEIGLLQTIPCLCSLLAPPLWGAIARSAPEAAPYVLGLLLVVFLGGTMFGIISAFLMLNLYELSGGSAQIVGIAIFCETFSELPAFYFADAIIDRLGTVKVLAISILAYGIRLTCYALMTNAWYVLPIELLHGCTYGLAWAASTKYIFAEVPRGTEGLMMGILSAVQTGLGRGVGTSVGGYLYNTYGASYMWAAADMGVPLAFLGLYIFSCTMPTHKTATAAESSPLLV
ncbi:hypothetical protein SPRG_21783 [Saprolegnia parasitica CBS 223.65]|uniref:Major facilitator superfamily (MFS) profile domain-containing protein n=1 Tax=Saprolegnia parasitica (strain CBS 223.65) TaxID=695850 RepID=A0A067BHA4_SAPPC|nr:hypothetical protein SPRG_21783 [Saprolegnia parasitica CBS 223.65]KDO17739.1 hypothetical protein SPRG_21783 [Saprolegnia parasitica CBS 223.65]|eukprot:XP_012211553.1 hypothetical protein SPRG_21783 [Saprolegnia parasitica CBS 223.65]